jgi:hypothetical protein
MADFVNSVATIFPGMGSPSQRVTKLDQAQAAGTSTYTLTAAAPGVRKGYIRVRTKAVNGATTTTSIKCTASDGTTTVVIFFEGGGLGAAGEAIDMVQQFNLDINAVTFVVTVITATNACTVDVELVAGA